MKSRSLVYWSAAELTNFAVLTNYVYWVSWDFKGIWSPKSKMLNPAKCNQLSCEIFTEWTVGVSLFRQSFSYFPLRFGHVLVLHWLRHIWIPNGNYIMELVKKNWSVFYGSFITKPLLALAPKCKACLTPKYGRKKTCPLQQLMMRNYLNMSF